MASVTIREIHKNYGAVPVLRGVSLAIADGEFAVLVGPSGCGKSTLLRMVAGLEDITSGEISIGGRVVNDLPPRSRDISMVFQNYALYPHMTVADNLAFALRLVKMPEAEVHKRTGDAAQMLGLTPLMARFPRQLSGGQRQRVAMGRAIVRQPQAFLFDEPLSNLDAKLRVTMRTEIKALHQRLRTTSIYVTHDQVEAMTMADRIVVMHDGHIEQQGTPLEVYDDPDNTFVAQFIGSPSMNLLPCTARSGALVIGADTLPAAVGGLRDGRALIAGVRPEHWLPVGEGGVAARIKVIEPTGADTLVYVDVAGVEVCVQLRERYALRVDEVMRLTVAPERAFLFDPETGQRIRSS